MPHPKDDPKNPEWRPYMSSGLAGTRELDKYIWFLNVPATLFARADEVIE